RSFRLHGTLEMRVRIPARTLGAIHRRVGVRYERTRQASVVRERRDPDARSNEQLVPLNLHRLSDATNDSLRENVDVGFAGNMRPQNDKFATPGSSGDVAAP